MDRYLLQIDTDSASQNAFLNQTIFEAHEVESFSIHKFIFALSAGFFLADFLDVASMLVLNSLYSILDHQVTLRRILKFTVALCLVLSAVGIEVLVLNTVENIWELLVIIVTIVVFFMAKDS